MAETHSSDSAAALRSQLERHRRLADDQRRHFGEERALWQEERSDLHEQIRYLKQTIEQAATSSIGSQVSSPPDRQPVQSTGGAPSFINTRQTSRNSIDPYTKDAGHTPIPKGEDASGGSDSSLESDTLAKAKPEQVSVAPKPPTDPKIPSERQDSYFPATEKEPSTDDQPQGSDPSPKPDQRGEDEDPSLKGILGLSENQETNKIFLSDLHRRLSQAKLDQLANSPPSSSQASPENAPPQPSGPSTAVGRDTQSITDKIKDMKESLPLADRSNLQTSGQASQADDKLKEDSSPGSVEGVRLKPTNNFGSPFGEFNKGNAPPK